MWGYACVILDSRVKVLKHVKEYEQGRVLIYPDGILRCMLIDLDALGAA